ncbi:MAG: hypothetical protein HY038_12890 [Nitrospirae bacterium]|nr:hypothetical protein [Nitrospirota bacterium]
MALHFFRWTVLGLVGLATAMTVGCTRWIDVMPSSTSRQETAAQSITNDDRVPFVIDTFRLLQNGASQNPSFEVERRILNSVQETRLFSTLVPLGGNVSSLGDKVVNARITMDETINPHSGEAAWKGFVIGPSMFLLSPIIELNYDYAAQASLELERWDGQVKHYEARSSGTARYNLFGATPIMIAELKGHVTEACLNQLMNQLVQDTKLYMASSTPLPGSTVRAVTVKAPKPVATPAALSIIPSSTASVP